MNSKEAIAAINSLHRYQPLAAAVPASQTNLRAWVGVYPLDLTRETTMEFLRSQGQPVPLPAIRAYHIRRFEVERSLLEQDAWIAEPDLQNKQSAFAYDDEALLVKLDGFGVRIEELTSHDKSDYPI